jgi:isoleucyl-tRNA synthetase
MVIWTTTPWTLPANVAIAVHPRQEYILGEFTGGPDGSLPHRFVVARTLLESFASETGFTLATELAAVPGKALADSAARHPFLDRKSRVITAEFVTMDTGTGQVHIAPGHGKDDYLASVEHGLPVLSPVDDYGKLTDEAGVPAWSGKYVFDANAEIVEHLRGIGALLAEQKYTHDYPHCWRSKTPIVFRAVEQFFIRVDDIRAGALRAIEETNWIPCMGP